VSIDRGGVLEGGRPLKPSAICTFRCSLNEEAVCGITPIVCVGEYENPSEEIVTAWLQRMQRVFTMNNIKVQSRKEGWGHEIDILGIKRNKKIWVEVSVSTNPRCNHLKNVRFDNTLRDYLKDFEREDKLKK